MAKVQQVVKPDLQRLHVDPVYAVDVLNENLNSGALDNVTSV